MYLTISKTDFLLAMPLPFDLIGLTDDIFILLRHRNFVLLVPHIRSAISWPDEPRLQPKTPPVTNPKLQRTEYLHFEIQKRDDYSEKDDTVKNLTKQRLLLPFMPKFSVKSLLFNI